MIFWKVTTLTHSSWAFCCNHSKLIVWYLSTVFEVSSFEQTPGSRSRQITTVCHLHVQITQTRGLLILSHPTCRLLLLFAWVLHNIGTSSKPKTKVQRTYVQVETKNFSSVSVEIPMYCRFSQRRKNSYWSFASLPLFSGTVCVCVVLHQYFLSWTKAQFLVCNVAILRIVPLDWSTSEYHYTRISREKYTGPHVCFRYQCHKPQPHAYVFIFCSIIAVEEIIIISQFFLTTDKCHIMSHVSRTPYDMVIPSKLHKLTHRKDTKLNVEHFAVSVNATTRLWERSELANVPKNWKQSWNGGWLGHSNNKQSASTDRYLWRNVGHFRRCEQSKSNSFVFQALLYCFDDWTNRLRGRKYLII